MDAYIYQAALLCSNCAKITMFDLDQDGKAPQTLADENTFDSDQYPKGPYSNGGGESDTPQHCDHCGAFLDNPLTDDGRQYVAAALADGRGAPDILAIWRVRYSDQLPAPSPTRQLLGNGELTNCQRCDGNGGNGAAVCDECEGLGVTSNAAI